MALKMARPSDRVVNSDTSRARIRVRRGLPVSSRPEIVCQVFFAASAIEVSSGEPRRLSAFK
jgi:hypothetical protein